MIIEITPINHNHHHQNNNNGRTLVPFLWWCDEWDPTPRAVVVDPGQRPFRCRVEVTPGSQKRNATGSLRFVFVLFSIP